MPLLTQHFIMLQRNLFYTALTRAKKLSVIVGSYKALHIAIKNDKPVKRNSLGQGKARRPRPGLRTAGLSVRCSSGLTPYMPRCSYRGERVCPFDGSALP